MRERAGVMLSGEQISTLEEVLSTGERLDGLTYLAQTHEIKYFAIRLVGVWYLLVYDQKTKKIKTLMRAGMTDALPKEGKRRLKRILTQS
jgi:hypothetical protein